MEKDYPISTVRGKKQFIRSLVGSIMKEALKNAEKMPENWDGHEIRKYLAEKFDREITARMRDGRSARVKAYNADSYWCNL